jgi:hypothetical protein
MDICANSEDLYEADARIVDAAVRIVSWILEKCIIKKDIKFDKNASFESVQQMIAGII